MVKIINGEIVADDDPRLQQRHQPSPPRPRSEAADTLGGASAPGGGPGGAGNAGGGGGIGFSLNAPPLRFVPPPPGVEPLPLPLPDAEVFGVRLSPYAILCAVTLGMFFGWRGLVMVLVVYYVYLASQNNAARDPGQQAQPGGPAGRGVGTQQQRQQQQSGSMPTDFLTRYMNGPQPRTRPAGATGHEAAGPEPPAGDSAARQAGAEGPGGAAGGGWAAFQGRGNKLGGK